MSARSIGYAVLVFVACLALGYWMLGIPGVDDKHITYFVARALAHGDGFVNVNGAHVEQSSSPLFVVTIALVHLASHANIVTIGHGLALVFGATTVVLTGQLTARLAPEATARRATLAAMALTASAVPVVYWALTGMETTLEATLFVALAIDWTASLQLPTGSLRRRYAVAATLVLAYELVRPEAAIVAFVAALAIAIWASRARPRLAREVLVFAWARVGMTVLGAGVLAGARAAYFGQLLSEPVAAKVHTSPTTVMNGVRYLVTDPLSAIVPALLLVAVLAAVWSVSRRERVLTVAALLVGTRLAFVIGSGGDWMGIGRFLVAPAGVAFAIACAIGMRWRATRIVTPLVVVAQLIALREIPERSATGIRPNADCDPGPYADRYSWFEYQNDLHLRDKAFVDAIAPFVERVVASRPGELVIYSGQAGMALYHLSDRVPGRIHFIDRFGLTTRDVRECALTTDAGHSPLGRVLFYVRYLDMLDALERDCGWPKPDLIFDPERSFQDLAPARPLYFWTAPPDHLADDDAVTARFTALGYTKLPTLLPPPPNACFDEPVYRAFARRELVEATK